MGDRVPIVRASGGRIMQDIGGRFGLHSLLHQRDHTSAQSGKNSSDELNERRGTPLPRLRARRFVAALVRASHLPKGFRRSGDYGFLHGNCKRLIQRLHLRLRVCLPKPKEKPPLCCKQCGGVVTLIPYPICPSRYARLYYLYSFLYAPMQSRLLWMP